jgi:hypothetical protein
MSARSKRPIIPRTKTTNRTPIAPRSPPEVTWEHSWTPHEIQTGLDNSPFRLLPTEVMLHIFKFLSVHNLGNVSSVCRSFKMIADQDEIWKLKCNCKIIRSFFLPFNLFLIYCSINKTTFEIF